MLQRWTFLIAAAGLFAPVALAQANIVVGSLTLNYCIKEYRGYCGTITVPLDRRGIVPGTLTVGFEFYPHTDTGHAAEGVILAQEGGPGYSTTGSRDGYVRMLAPLRDHRDILLIDKRGTGRSSAIDCPELQKAYLPDQADIAACAEQLGESAWFYRSADAADDVAAVMTALQVGPADYYGDSYGTWFGQVLAVLHPELLRTIVLDSAYPIIGDDANSEVNHGQRAMDIVCERSAPCSGLGGSATARFAALLASLRAQPVSGIAPGASGEPLQVTADPEGLFLVMANAGNAPTTWRDLDAAGRAWMDKQDALPLLRLVAEARDAYSGGGPAKDFSVGLADAVQCAEYGGFYNLTDSLDTRLVQYRHALQRLRTDRPDSFSPFIIDDAVHSQMNAEEYDTCLTWPAPPAGVAQAEPIPPGSVFPDVPVLVFSGELDTVTSPSEGAATAALFPRSTYIRTRNLVHESAISDAGYFVSPQGEDLSRCIGPIVRHFMSSGGDTGDISCVAGIRPIRTVPAFVIDYEATFPASPVSGNKVDAAGLVLASAVAETVGDVIARYYVNNSGSGSGLRGGTFSFAPDAHGYNFDLQQVEWAKGLTVSGKILWNEETGKIHASVTFNAVGHSGSMKVDWDDRQTEAQAALNGTIDGATLAATRLAP